MNIASIEGIEGTEGGSAYNASKGGVVILTKNMAIDYGRAGIRVERGLPGLHRHADDPGVFGMDGMEDVLADIVDAHPLGRLGRPEEIAAAALFLALRRRVVRHRARARRSTAATPPATATASRTDGPRLTGFGSRDGALAGGVRVGD